MRNSQTEIDGHNQVTNLPATAKRPEPHASADSERQRFEPVQCLEEVVHVKRHINDRRTVGSYVLYPGTDARPKYQDNGND